MITSSTKKVENHSLKSKKVKTDLQKRLFSAIFLVILMVIYLLLPILHTEIMRKQEYESVVAIGLGSAGIFATICIIAFSIWEISNAVGIKGKQIKILFVSLAVILFIWPFGTWDALEQIFAYRLLTETFISSLNKWWILSLLMILIFVVFYVVSVKLSNKNHLESQIKIENEKYGNNNYLESKKTPNVTKKPLTKRTIFLVYFVMIIVVFAMKGFSNVSLSLVNVGNIFLDSTRDYTESEIYLFIPSYSFTALIWIWCTIIFTDTFAYLGGSKFGKHKLAPKISPNKSWEGAIIGTSVAVLIGIIFSVTLYYLSDTRSFAPFFGIFIFFFNDSAFWFPGFLLIVITVIVSVVGQLGDLLFSWIKRYLGIKDYSNLIPGHGGLLDRLDSFYFVFFIFYVITTFLYIV